MSTATSFDAELSKALKALGFESNFNVTLNPPAPHPDVPTGETAVMEYIDPDGRRYLFTGTGFTIPGHGFILYKDASHIDWPPFGPDRRADYKDYLVIYFRDRPAITFRVGHERSVALGGLIICTRSIAITLAGNKIDCTPS
jgi:hypothetical protein